MTPENYVDHPNGASVRDRIRCGLTIPIVTSGPNHGPLGLHGEQYFGGQPPSSSELFWTEKICRAEDRASGSRHQNIDDLITGAHSGIDPQLSAARELLEILELRPVSTQSFEIHDTEPLVLCRKAVGDIKRVGPFSCVVHYRLEHAGNRLHDMPGIQVHSRY
jgi:hypothetical protein